MVTVPTPDGDWVEADADVPVVAPAPVAPAPTPTTAAVLAPRPTPSATPEPEIVSPEEIARIQAEAEAEIAAEAARATPAATPVPSGRLGSAVPDMVRRWEPLILAACERYKVDPNLIAALMMTESGGNPQALSHAGARGLMQIIDGPWDPAENIRLGTAIMADNLRRYGGRVELALAGYNAGNGAVAKYGGIPPYRETRDHVFRVLLRYELYRSG
jgi:soluble lytic murein transglycosylase-like protein